MAVVESQQLVGREEEISRLEEFLTCGTSGSASLLLEGEPGIGKTTIWRAGVERADELGFRVLQARPAAAERELPFAALGDLLSGVLDQIGALPSPQRRALRIALALSDANGKPPEKRTLAMAVLGLLRVLAQEDPVLVALDDAHWLDAQSASTLRFAIRRLDGESVRVLATCRPPAEAASLGAGERLMLGPLPVDALDRLVRSRLGVQFLRPTLRQLQQASGGNAFYALEIAAAFLRSGRRLEPGEELPVPAELRDVVRDRLAELTPAAREAALVTAALAQPTVALVEQASRAGVHEAIAASILEEAGETLRFTHPLFASTLYEDTTPTRRRDVHRRAAEIVDGLEERARHLAEASDCPDEEVAAALERAAVSLASRGAADAATKLAKQAADLTPSDRRSDRHRRRLTWARYSAHAGDPAFAEQLLERQLEPSAPGRERSEVLLELGKIHELGHGVAGTRAYYERALAELEDTNDAELRTRIMVELGAMDINEIRTDSDASEQAVALAERLENPDLLARALANHGHWLTCVRRPPSDDYWRRAIEVEASSGELRMDGPTHSYAYVAFMRGDLELSAELGRRVMDSFARTGDPQLAGLLMESSEREREMGNPQAAARYADEAHELVLQTGRELLEPACLLLKARLNTRFGELALARTQAEKAIELSNSMQKTETGRAFIDMLGKTVLGQVATEHGDHEEAHEFLSAAIEAAERLEGFGDAFAAQVTAGTVEQLVTLGRFEEAVQQLERLETATEAVAAPWLDAVTARACGFVAAASGDTSGALAHFERALSIMEAAPTSRFELGRTLLALGQLQRRSRQKLAARTTLERANDVFESAGARLWAEKARAELRQIGGRPAADCALSSSEHRIAERVAAGRSNAEVAQELFISSKTVEWHLSKIYRKLHVRSRAELAARFAQRASNQ